MISPSSVQPAAIDESSIIFAAVPSPPLLIHPTKGRGGCSKFVSSLVQRLDQPADPQAVDGPHSEQNRPDDGWSGKSMHAGRAPGLRGC